MPLKERQFFPLYAPHTRSAVIGGSNNLRPIGTKSRAPEFSSMALKETLWAVVTHLYDDTDNDGDDEQSACEQSEEAQKLFVTRGLVQRLLVVLRRSGMVVGHQRSSLSIEAG
jgi:hypothetical protein